MDLKFIGIGFVIAIAYYYIQSTMKKVTKKHMTHDAHDDEDVEVLAKSGRKIAAVKAYMKLHGVSLKEAKEVVDRMMSESFHESEHVDDDMNLDVDEKILRIAKSGHKIQAIKLYRETYGVGLKYAKDAVETMLRND